jgi:hypothetical protein
LVTQDEDKEDKSTVFVLCNQGFFCGLCSCYFSVLCFCLLCLRPVEPRFFVGSVLLLLFCLSKFKSFCFVTILDISLMSRACKNVHIIFSVRTITIFPLFYPTTTKIMYDTIISMELLAILLVTS